MKRGLQVLLISLAIISGIIFLRLNGQNKFLSDGKPYDYGILDQWNRNTSYDSIMSYLKPRYDKWRTENPIWIAETFKYYYLGLCDSKVVGVKDSIIKYEELVRDFSGESLALSFIYNIKVQDFLEKGEWDEAKELAELLSDRALLGEVYPRLYAEVKSLASFISLAYGDRKKALRLNEEADSIFVIQFGADFFGRLVSINNFGLILEHLGRHEEALKYGLESIEIVKKYYAESHENLPKVLNSLGLKYHNLGKTEEAIKIFQEAITLNKKYGHDLNLFSVYMNINRSYTAKYDYENAEKYLTLAEETLKSKDGFFPNYELEVLMRKATSYNKSEDNDGLSEIIKTILDLIRNNFEESDYASVKPYALLFTFYLEKKDFQNAAKFIDKYMNVLSLYVDEDNDEWANALGWKGELFNAMGLADSSIIYNNKSIEIYEKAMGPWHHYIFEVRLIQAQAYAQKGDFHGADSVLNLSLISEFPNQVSLDPILKIPNFENLYKHIHLLGTLKLKLKYITKVASEDDANGLERKAILFDYLSLEYDRLLSFYGGFHYREDLREGSSDIFRQALAVCYELYQITGNQYWVDKAFEYSERTKSLKIQEILRERIANIEGGVPDSLRQKESELLLYKFNLQEQLDGISPDDSLSYYSIKSRLAEADIAHLNFVKKLEQSFPNYYNLKYNVNLSTPQQVKNKMLKKSRALIQFNIWNDTCYVIITSKNKSEFISIHLPENIEDIVLEFYTAQKNREFASFNEYGSILYKVLYAPMKSYLEPFDELIVVPDSWLYYINLEALPVSDQEGGYLIQRHHIFYTYSPTVSIQHMTLQNVIEADLEWVGFVPGFEKSIDGMQNGPSYVSQPWAVDLARTIKGQFKSVLFEGKEANKSTFYKEASSGKLLHIGTHAVADDEDPMNSYMVLSGESDQEYVLLKASELYSKDIQSSCAILTACETAVGKIKGGEGMVSLARAFTYAGCPNLVVILWSVDDQQTANIMRHFYQNVASGNSLASSLYEAKLSYLLSSKGELKHPFYWAGIVYYGMDVTIKSAINYWIAGALVVLLLFLSAGFYYFHKRRTPTIF